jgi:ribonucleoside-diphosphate reductase alpha chain
LFLDTIARANPLPGCGSIEATNPCGEVPLLPYESCNLGSINLTHFVREGQNGQEIDFDRLRELVHDGVRFLDDVISVTRSPIAEIARETLAHRKIGLGVMGFADLCILLRVPYASDEALDMAERLMGFIAVEARSASHNLAEERGAFPHWDASIYADSGLRLRNATTTSIAPTGTLSILAGTSPSIEPLFALAYRRRVLENQVLTEFSPLILPHLARLGGDVERAMDEIASTGRLGSMGDGADLFKTALEIDPEHHVRIQAAFQKHVDNAVSKTVNVPSDATPQSVAKVYQLAHRLGCKGVTVFRYGSRSDVVLELGLDQTPEERDNFTQCDPAACRL